MEGKVLVCAEYKTLAKALSQCVERLGYEAASLIADPNAEAISDAIETHKPTHIVMSYKDRGQPSKELLGEVRARSKAKATTTQIKATPESSGDRLLRPAL